MLPLFDFELDLLTHLSQESNERVVKKVTRPMELNLVIIEYFKKNLSKYLFKSSSCQTFWTSLLDGHQKLRTATECLCSWGDAIE